MKTKTLRFKKLSTLLAIGLRDAKKQEKARRSVIDMGGWLWKEDGVCHACLAGSVLRYTCGVRARGNGVDDKYAWMWALDKLRRGDVPLAAEELGRMPSIKHWQLNRIITNYNDNPQQWWKDMRQLLKDLRKAGL